MAENQSGQPQDQKPTNETADQAKSAAKEIEEGKGMAILAYILAPIPYFTEKNNKFVRYHAIQGMNIFIIAVAYAILATIINNIVWRIFASSCTNSLMAGSINGCGSGMANFISWIIGLVGLAVAVIDIIGLVYAAQGEKKEVPVLEKIRIIKNS